MITRKQLAAWLAVALFAGSAVATFVLIRLAVTVIQGPVSASNG